MTVDTSNHRSDRSYLEKRWKGGEAFSPDKPDVLEQQPHWSSNRGIDCHKLREGGGGHQHQWKDDVLPPPSSMMNPSPMDTNSRQGGGGDGDGDLQSHIKDDHSFMIQPNHVADAGRGGLYSKCNGRNSSGGERWQKRRGFDTPPHVVQYVGGSEDTSGRVWSREKDRGANPPAGKSPPSDCQNLCNDEISRLERHPLPKCLAIGRGGFSDQNPTTPPPKSSSSHHHPVDDTFGGSGGFRRSQPINSDTGVPPPSLGSSLCALERGDDVRGGAGAGSVKQSRFHDSKAWPSTEELSSKPPPSALSSSPSQDRSYERNYERDSYRDSRKWDRERGLTSRRQLPSRYNTPYHSSPSGSQSQSSGYPSPSHRVSSDLPSLGGSSSQPGGEGSRHMLRETDNKPAASFCPSNLPDKSGGGGQRRGWKERDFVSLQSPCESPYKSPMSEWVGGSSGGSSSWGANRPGMGKTSCKSPHSSRGDRRQPPNTMNHHPKRFNHHTPGRGRNKQDYYGPSSNSAARPDFGVERGGGFSKGSGGNGMAYESDKYYGYPSNGEFRNTRGTGSSSVDRLRYDPLNSKESSSGSNSVYLHEEREQGASVPKTTGAFWSEQKPQHSDRGVIQNENNKSRAVHQHQQLPLCQPWQSNVRSFPSKRDLSGTDFPDSTKGRGKSHGDMPAVNMKPERSIGGEEEKIEKFESSQLSGRAVVTSLEETDQWHQERVYTLQEMEEGECTPPALMSSHSLTRQSYPSIAAHKERERSGALPSPPFPPPTVDETLVLPPSLQTPSQFSFDEEQGSVGPFQKETGSSTINAVQSEAAAPVAPHQYSPVVPPTAVSIMSSTPTSNITHSSSPLSVTQPPLRRGLLHLIGTSSSALYSSQQGPPSACGAPQDSCMLSLSSSDVHSNKPPLAPMNLESTGPSTNSSPKPLELENVSKSLESDGVTKPVGQQQPARLGWGMSLNRMRNTESSSSLLALATASKEDIKTEEKKTTPIEKEEVVNNNDTIPPGSQGSTKHDQVGGGSCALITPGNDSGPKHLSWGMSLRRPVGVGKLGMSNDSPRCHDTTTTTTTTVLSSFHEADNGKLKLLDDSALKEPTHPTRSDTFDSVSPVKTKAATYNEMGGGGDEGLKSIVCNQREKDVHIPCKRKKEEVKQQQPQQKFIKMDYSMPLSAVKTEANEMVIQNSNENFTAITATATATAVNISDGLKNLVSHQPPILPPTQKGIHMKQANSSSMLYNSPSTTATDVIIGDTDTAISSDDAAVLSTSESQQLHEERSVEVIYKGIIKDMDVASKSSEYEGGLLPQSKVIRKKEQRLEEFRGVVKPQIEKESKQLPPSTHPPTIIPSLHLDTLKGVKQTAETETETETETTTAVEMKQQQGSLSMVTSPICTPSEKVSKKKVATLRGTRELASLTGNGNTPYASTPRRSSKLGTTAASHASVRHLSKLGMESSIGSKGTAAMSPIGTATKWRRRSVQASTVDKEDIQWGDNSTSSPWDPFVSAVIGGASTVRILDVVKMPADMEKAIEALQYLRFLEGHRKDVICRVATPNAPLPLPHVFQSALRKVKMKLREIDRQLTYKEKELGAQQRRKENKMLFDEVSCDSMALDAKVWDNPVSLVEAISKAKAVRQMLLAWPEQFPQIKPRPQHPYYTMKNSLQGSSTTTKMQITSSYSLPLPVNAFYRHSEDLESVAKILTYNRCLAMAAHSASTVRHHCVNCILPHQKRQLMPTSPELASRIAKAVLKRKIDVHMKLEFLGNEYALLQSKWKSRISILEKGENKEETAASSKGSLLRDIVRSDYEQEQMLMELMAKEAKQLKMDNGCTSPPAMLTMVERSQLQEISYGSVDIPWNTSDGEHMLCEDFPLYQSCPTACNCFRTMEKTVRMENPWTDREKCMFLQQFLVHPKDFYAISHYLPNKQTHDVVCFYYDTKQYVDYKEVLKEHTQRVREKMRGIVIEDDGTGRWPATFSAANCMGTVISLTDPSDPTSLTFKLPREGLYTTLHAHPPAALATIPDLKREALELSRKGVVRKIQAPLGLKGVKSDIMSTEQLDEVDVSAPTLNLVAYHLALSLCPTLGRDPPPFRRSKRDVAYVSSCTGSPGRLHLCGVIETSSRGGNGGRGRGSKLRDGDCLFGRSYNKDSDEADLQLFLKNQSCAGSNSSSSTVNITSSGSCQNLRRKNRVFLSSSSDNSEKVSSSGSGGRDVIRSGGQKWKDEEKEAFLSHFNQVGKDWLALAKAIPGKATNQIKNYYQNYKVKLGLVEPVIKCNNMNDNSSDGNITTNVNITTATTTKTEDEVKKDTTQLPVCSSTGRDGNQQPPLFTTEEAVGSSVVALDATVYHSSRVSSDNGGDGDALVDNLNGHTTSFLHSPVYNTIPHHSSSSHGGDGYKLDQEGNPSCAVASERPQLDCVIVAHSEQKQQQQPTIVKAEGEEGHHSMPVLPIEGNDDRCSYTGGERQQNTDSLSVGGGGATSTAQNCYASMSLQQCSNIQVHQQEEGEGPAL